MNVSCLVAIGRIRCAKPPRRQAHEITLEKKGVPGNKDYLAMTEADLERDAKTVRKRLELKRGTSRGFLAVTSDPRWAGSKPRAVRTMRLAKGPDGTRGFASRVPGYDSTPCRALAHRPCQGPFCRTKNPKVWPSPTHSMLYKLKKREPNPKQTRKRPNSSKILCS